MAIKGFRVSPTSGRRRVFASSASAHDGQPTKRFQPASQQAQLQPEAACQRNLNHDAQWSDRQAAVSASGPKHVLILSSTSSSLAATADALLPTAFARVLVGAALALSTVYALLSSPASPTTASTFAPSARGATPSTSSDPAIPGVAAATPAFPSLPILRTPEQFDAFVLASNRAGYLAVVLFHAPWCSASQRMEVELQRLYRLVEKRRVVFARVDCSIKQGIMPGQKLGSATASGFRLQRCDLTQLHRIHKTPTVRMYFNNACVDEIIGCRPIDFRQATSDLTFKYNL